MIIMAGVDINLLIVIGFGLITLVLILIDLWMHNRG